MFLILSIAGLSLILQNVNCQIKDSALQDTVLKLHNGYRRLQMASNMKKLVWDANLASEAASWTKNCIYEFRYGSYGENMYYFESRLPDNVLVERAIDAWYSERYSWRMSGDCAEACSYTQLVWAKTQRVGCAVQKCTELTMPEEFIPGAWFLYCLYDPKGNTFGDLPYSRGGACEKCDAKEVCSDKLCADKYAPTTPQPVKTTPPPTLPSIQIGSQSSNTELTQLEMQHRTALEKQQALLQETLKKQKALEQQLRTQQKLIEQTLLVGKSLTTAKPSVTWSKGLPTDVNRRSDVDQGSANSRNGMMSSSMLGTRSGPTDDKTELSRRPVQISSVGDRDSRRKPVSDVQEASFFSFHRPRNQFSSVRLWQPTTTRAPLFVLNPQPQISSLQKTVTSMRPLKPNKNRVSFTIGSGSTLKFNYKPNSSLVTQSQRETALPGQNKLDLSASDNFRFGGARSLESQLASSGNLRSKERQHTSLSLLQAHSSTSDQKQTISGGGQSWGRSEVNNLQLQTTKQQASVTSVQQSQKGQSPDFGSRTVFTSRTKAPSTSAPSFLPASPTLPPTTIPPDCVDKDVYCPYWKVYCDHNSYVFENCRRTCKSCYVPPPPIIPQPPLETLTSSNTNQQQQYQETSQQIQTNQITQDKSNYIQQTIIQEKPNVVQNVQLDQQFQQQPSNNQQTQYMMQQPQSGFQQEPQIIQQPQPLYQQPQPQVYQQPQPQVYQQPQPQMYQQSGFQQFQGQQSVQPIMGFNQQQSYDYVQPTSAIQPWHGGMLGHQGNHGNNMLVGFQQTNNQLQGNQQFTEPPTPKPTKTIRLEFRGHTPATASFKKQPIKPREPAGEISPYIKVQEPLPEGVELRTTTPTTTTTTTSTTTTTTTKPPPTRAPTRPPTTHPPQFFNHGAYGINHYYPNNNMYNNNNYHTQNIHYQNTNSQMHQTHQTNHMQTNQVYNHNNYQPNFATRQQIYRQTTPSPMIFNQQMIQQNTPAPIIFQQQRTQQPNPQGMNNFLGQSQQIQVQSLDLNVPIRSSSAILSPNQQQPRINIQYQQQVQQPNQFTKAPANQNVQYQQSKSEDVFKNALMRANFGQANINLASNLGTQPGQYQRVQASSDVSWYYSVSTRPPNVVPTEPFPTKPLLDLNLKLFENPNVVVQTNSSTPAQSQPSACVDVDARCPQWTQWCGIDQYVDNNCKKLCKNCR